MSNREYILPTDHKKLIIAKIKHEKAVILLEQYNAIGNVPKGKEILKKLIQRIGDDFCIEPPFCCNIGSNIEIGEHFYSNRNLLILDDTKVTIGDSVMFGPNVNIYTGTHPIHSKDREAGICISNSVTIGNHVWIGGNVVINPGVQIGDCTVIGSGSVVTKSMPPNVVAAGNPCKVIRNITKEDLHR